MKLLIYFNLDLGKIIKVGNRNDFKMSGTQAKQLRVVRQLKKDLFIYYKTHSR